VDLSIVIPIYNEETNLPALTARVSAVLDALPLQTELIYVNDGSRDRSLDPRIHFINFSRNFGHQIAITAGLDLSSGATVVVMDGDLQDPPELIPELYQKLHEGYEVVYAKRRTRQGESMIKLFTAKMFYRLLARITSVDIPLDTGDFRIVSRKVVNALKQMPEQNKFIRGQISWIGYRQTFLEFDRSERAGGVPGYTYSKLIKYYLFFRSAPARGYRGRVRGVRRGVSGDDVCRLRPLFHAQLRRGLALPDGQYPVYRRRAATGRGRHRRVHCPPGRQCPAAAPLHHRRYRRAGFGPERN
jgi:glycosyltransferase involved in cell wall biosynthesis